MLVEGTSGRCYVGRYHERTERGILVHDVAVHDPATSPHSREEFLARTAKFGVRAEHRHLVLADDEVGIIRRLVEVTGSE